MFFQTAKDVSSYRLINNPRKLSWLIDTLLKQKEFAFDIETNHPTVRSGKKPSNFVEVLSGVSFAWNRNPESEWKPGDAAYIPVSKSDDSPFWHSRQDAVIDVIKEVLESDIPKVAQYGKFDIFKLHRLQGIAVKNFAFDTHLAHSLLDEERLVSSHALKSDFDKNGNLIKLGMADAYLDGNASNPKDDLEAALDHYDPVYRRYSKVPLNTLYKYGCADSDYTLALKYIFEPMLEREGLTWVFQNITMPLQLELAITELCGMPLDLEAANRIKAEQEVIMSGCLNRAAEIIGKNIDLGSPTQVGKVLFEDLALPGGKRNKQGWVTESEVIERISHPIIGVILKFRRAQKIHGSFTVPALEGVKEITDEGRIGWVHMTYFPDTLTGRLRGSDPNLTALPRPENGGDIVKSMWTCEEGYKFIFKDYSQIELRFIAHCSGEPTWIEGFNNNQDAHSLMAQRIWHPDKSVEDVKKYHDDDRSKAKAVNFGIAFGKSEFNLAEELGITYEEAYRLKNEEYFGAAPVLKQWIDDTHDFAKNYGYIQNIFGRRRHLPDAMIKVPEYMQWPRKIGRPNCYARGMYFDQLGLDQYWNWREQHHEDEWYDLVNGLNEDKIRGLIQATGNNYFAKCLGCEHVFTCTINSEIKRIGGIVGKCMRVSINSPIQGGASDMINLAWVWIGQEFRKQGIDAYVVLDVHDELIVYSHTSCIETASRIMDYYMTTYMHEYTQFRVPLIVDTEVVARWSDKYDKE